MPAQTSVTSNGTIIVPLDITETVFSRCVTTNNGKDEIKEEKVLANCHLQKKLQIKFNYEFLEDFQGKQFSSKLSSGEEDATDIDIPKQDISAKFLTIVVQGTDYQWVLHEV